MIAQNKAEENVNDIIYYLSDIILYNSTNDYGNAFVFVSLLVTSNFFFKIIDNNTIKNYILSIL